MASVDTDAQAARGAEISVGRAAMLAGGALALGLAGLLWWRFGEAVFASGLMNAILSCF
jgi:hypothetical protein